MAETEEPRVLVAVSRIDPHTLSETTGLPEAVLTVVMIMYAHRSVGTSRPISRSAASTAPANQAERRGSPQRYWNNTRPAGNGCAQPPSGPPPCPRPRSAHTPPNEFR